MRPSPIRSAARRSHPIEAISLIAEIALGLAGFAGVAVVLGRGPEYWGDGDSLRIRLLLSSAFAALFAALAATGGQWAGAGEATSVQLGAGVLLIGQLYWYFFLARRINDLEPSQRALFDPRLARFLRLFVVSSCVSQLVASAGLARHFGRWLFLYGLFCSLAYAALGFVRFMFIRPDTE